jgi:hypothetical protein
MFLASTPITLYNGYSPPRDKSSCTTSDVDSNNSRADPLVQFNAVPSSGRLTGASLLPPFDPDDNQPLPYSVHQCSSFPTLALVGSLLRSLRVRVENWTSPVSMHVGCTMLLSLISGWVYKWV